MAKYYLVWRGYGKSSYQVPKPCSSKKLKELEGSGEKIYNSKQEAKEDAIKTRK